MRLSLTSHSLLHNDLLTIDDIQTLLSLLNTLTTNCVDGSILHLISSNAVDASTSSGDGHLQILSNADLISTSILQNNTTIIYKNKLKVRLQKRKGGPGGGEETSCSQGGHSTVRDDCLRSIQAV